MWRRGTTRNMMPEAGARSEGASGARVPGGALRREARPEHPFESGPNVERLVLLSWDSPGAFRPMDTTLLKQKA
jgi:hypothetical protein